MIRVEHVTKWYGNHQALNDVSFTVNKNQVIGLLGQNGAGKTTLMNIITGYMPPTNGRILIDSDDMMLEPGICKSKIGYLPEKPPLYEEMKVREYLDFVCGLRGVYRKEKKQHIDEVMRICDISSVADKCIGTLSKGYRQRIGIAQALCGTPEILVLDEPTVGLDPVQVVETRKLIKALSHEHIVIISSHILSEVEQMCDRVIVLDQGCVALDIEKNEIESADVLMLRVVVEANEKELLPKLHQLTCVTRIRVLKYAHPENVELVIECRKDQAERPQTQLLKLFTANGIPVIMIYPETGKLESVFLNTINHGNEQQ